MNLEEKFQQLCDKENQFDPDLHPLLYKYSKECSHITEVGVRWVETTFSFLMGKPKTLIMYDVDSPEIHTKFNGAENFRLAKKLAKDQNTKLEFTQADILKIDIEKTDLLYIDTEHSYLQLKSELRKHADKAQKYIIMHDTETHAYVDSNSYGLRHTLKKIDDDDYNKFGLKLAIDEFLESNKEWKLHECSKTGQGLTILKRI